MQAPKLLLVDDHQTNLDTLEAMLAGEGYQIYTASSGLEAIELAAGLHPDIILLDVMMPEMDGFEVCERIRKNPALQQTPILLLTALGDHASLLRGINSGADDFISKPVNLEILRARVRTIVRLNRACIIDALRQSEERFRQLAENVNEVFWILERASKRVIYASPAYETIWGRSCAALYADPREWTDAIHADDRARVLAVIEGDSPEPFDHVYRILRPDGETRWVRERGFPMRDAEGCVQRLVGTAEDITMMRRLQEQLLQSQKMEAIGTLAGGIAHDFNNILGGIVGFTELTRLRAGDNPKLREPLDAVLQASRRAASLVRQILAFSRHHERHIEVVQLRLIVSEAMKLLRASIPSTIEFDLRLASDVGLVRADPTQIHQIVLNLCSNAEHAMRGHPGRLCVALANVEADSALCAAHTRLRPGPYVRLTVSDTGCGIKTELMTRVFEPFFTTKPAGEGSGLGLSVVHGIMESHGGVVTVESKPGVGTRFDLYFPTERLSQTPATATAPPFPPSRGEGESILFVDDDPDLAALGRAALSELGYHVESCILPTEALGLLRARSFDLVVTDHTMPGMTGIEFAAKVQAIRPRIPVVLVTGYCAGKISEQAVMAGIKEVVFKPIDLSALSAAVRRCLPRT